MPNDGISTIKGLQTVLTLAMLVASTQTAQNYQARFAIKIKPLLFDITNSSF